MSGQGGMHAIDYALVLAYAVTVLLLGWYYARRQTATDEYYTGGGKMNSGLIGISLFVTLLSTITYLARPGEAIQHGPMTFLGLLSAPISFVLVGYWLIPVLMRQRVTSAYELLEVRLGMGIRLLAASLFLLLRLAWMALMLFITSNVLAVVLGVDPGWVPLIAATSGMVAVLYTSVGGLRTVVITDFFQFLCLLVGAVMTIVIISFRMGGFGWWPTEWAPNWDVQPVFSFDPRVRVTVVGALISAMVWNVCTAGGDQTAVQRYMSTVDARAARRSYLVTTGCILVVSALLMLVGFSLLGYFQANPHLLPEGMDLATSGDAIFPLFIAQHLPVGLTGLVVAALFAAAMSSIDSGVNSVTAVVQTDFLGMFGLQPKTEKGRMAFAKGLAFGIGVVIVSTSSLMRYVPGNFLELTQKVSNLFVSPIFGFFFLALFVPYATPLGALVGGVYGIAVAVLIGYWDVLTGLPGLSFTLIGVSSLVTHIAVGCAVSYWGPKRGNGKAAFITGLALFVLLALLIWALLRWAPEVFA